MQFLLPFFLVLGISAAYLAPTPPGKYNVTLTTGELIDWSRNDPYAPTPTPRTLMLSVFQPAKCASTVAVPDMPEKTAKYQGPVLEKLFNITFDISPLFLGAQLPVCPAHDGGCSLLDDGPILLFSPGYSIPRLYYNVLASAIASEGFTVITIDHPEDANIVVYPDGHAVYNNATTDDGQYWDGYARAADASFVIDQLSNATAIAKLLPQRGPRPFPVDRIAMSGHSCGGAASILAAHQDPRIRAVINWDGNICAPRNTPVSQPVLSMLRGEIVAEYWAPAWPTWTAPKLMLHIKNATHQSFSDIPTLFEAAGKSLAPFASLLGTIEPAEMVDILTTMTTMWMEGAFRGSEEEALLEIKKFPAIQILEEGNFNNGKHSS